MFLASLHTFCAQTKKMNEYRTVRAQTYAWDFEGDGIYDEIQPYRIEEIKISNEDTSIVNAYPRKKKKVSMTKQEIMNEYGPDVIFYDGVCDEEGKN